MVMFRALQADEIECRISSVEKNGVSLLLYKNARCDQNILDETVGAERWQRSHELINGNLFCNVGIWFDRRNDGYGEWVWKQDVGVESYTEKEKGQASDAFKRACFNWGIGRELYTAPPLIWISADQCNIREGQNGKLTCYDRFTVSDIDYDGARRINKLVIKKGETVVYKMVDPNVKNATISEIKIKALKETLSQKGITEEYLLRSCNKKNLEDITEGQFSWIATNIDDIKKRFDAWSAKEE